jgi:hypothetical protein
MGLHIQDPLFLSDFNEKCFFKTEFRINKPISNFMKIRPVGDELFHADGQTDKHDEANSHFSQMCEPA